MFWADVEEQRLVVGREETPTAKKEHTCCECQEKIRKGEKYFYFFGVWKDRYGEQSAVYKTCLSCEEDWDEILEVFHKNGEPDARVIFGALAEAVQDAFDADFLKVGHPLESKWLGTEPEVNVETLSLEEVEKRKRKEAAFQMKVYSAPLL